MTFEEWLCGDESPNRITLKVVWEEAIKIERERCARVAECATMDPTGVGELIAEQIRQG